MNHDFVLTWEKMFSGQKYQREDREISAESMDVEGQPSITN